MDSFSKIIDFIFTNSTNDDQLNELKKIGNGNFGTVYSAVWLTKEREQIEVAIKVFNNDIDNDEKELRNYEEEVNKMSKLSHKNVVFFYGEAKIDGKNALIMELADYSLDKIIHQEDQLYLFGQLLKLLIDVTEGLIYMHQNNIIHRDLKPANLLVFHENENSLIAKIADFGISREKITTNSTMTNEIGTPAYTAPEVIQGSKYDRRCDVYSFGIILWEALTRRKPFAGLSNVQILFAVAHGKRPDCSCIKCHDEIRTLIEKCWENDFEKRLEMKEVMTSLNKFSSQPLIFLNENCLSSQVWEAKTTRSSVEKWRIFRCLSSELKKQIHLAVVYEKITYKIALLITKDEEAFWLWNGRSFPEESFSVAGLKIKNFIFTKLYLNRFTVDTTRVMALTEFGQVLVLTPLFDFIEEVTGFTEKIVQLACGDEHTLALTSGGGVFAWGENVSGQLGMKADKKYYSKPLKVTEEIGSRRIVAVACCRLSSFAITDDGEVYAWGDTNLFLDDENKRKWTPKRIEALVGVRICRLACGHEHALALSDDGSMYAWGFNSYGQLGTGDRKNRNIPVKVGPDGVKFIEVAACNSESDLSVALSEDGRCWVWGRCRILNNSDFQGEDTFENVLLPRPVESASIQDAFADYSYFQTTWKTMVASYQEIIELEY